MIVNSRSTVEANKAVIKNWFEGLSGERELDYALVASDVVNHTASALGLRDGAENFKRVMQIVQAAAPDQNWKVHALIAEGDLVVCRVTWSGTHSGIFLGVPATNRPFSVEHIHIFRVSAGRIAEHWAVRDDLAMLGQIGVASDPRSPGQQSGGHSSQVQPVGWESADAPAISTSERTQASMLGGRPA